MTGVDVPVRFEVPSYELKLRLNDGQMMDSEYATEQMRRLISEHVGGGIDASSVTFKTEIDGVLVPLPEVSAKEFLAAEHFVIAKGAGGVLELIASQLKQLTAVSKQHSIDIAKLESTVAKHESILAKHYSTLSKHESTLAKHESTLAKHESTLASQGALIAHMTTDRRLRVALQMVMQLENKIARATCPGLGSPYQARFCALKYLDDVPSHDPTLLQPILRRHPLLRQAMKRMCMLGVPPPHPATVTLDNGEEVEPTEAMLQAVIEAFFQDSDLLLSAQEVLKCLVALSIQLQEPLFVDTLTAPAS